MVSLVNEGTWRSSLGTSVAQEGCLCQGARLRVLDTLTNARVFPTPIQHYKNFFGHCVNEILGSVVSVLLTPYYERTYNHISLTTVLVRTYNSAIGW